ncbi:hypothetical protein ACIHFE_14565 [Streptomyces sp. NPDC052396]|uniref:hypothetical protein n=1 Tax=Streptomyces sp. NPDC052396 TaxID=3365689 RepID=UPI0037D063C3
MASTRTAARVLAAAAAVPVAAVLLTGVAQADDGHHGQRASHGSNAAVAEVVGSGVGGSNHGNASTTEQVATGSSATNQANTANVNDPYGYGRTAIYQENVKIVFTSIHDEHDNRFYNAHDYR